MANQFSSKKRLVSGILSASMVLSLFTGFSGADAAETEAAARAVGVTRSGLQRDAQVVMSKENLGAAQIAMPMVIDKTSIGFTGEAGEHLQIDIVTLCHLYRTVMEYLGAQGRQLQHLIKGDLLELMGLGHQPGIGGVHAVHIGVDLAQVSVETGRQGYRRGV